MEPGCLLLLLLLLLPFWPAAAAAAATRCLMCCVRHLSMTSCQSVTMKMSSTPSWHDRWGCTLIMWIQFSHVTSCVCALCHNTGSSIGRHVTVSAQLSMIGSMSLMCAGCCSALHAPHAHAHAGWCMRDLQTLLPRQHQLV